MTARRIAIIGSFRQHYPEVLSAWSCFRAAGWLVTSPLGSAILEEGIPFVRFRLDEPSWDDPTVQTVALHRILRADLTYVVAPGGYVGRTTCYELGRAIQARRPLYFSAPPEDLPIAVPDAHVGSPADIVTRLSETHPQALFSTPENVYAEWELRLITGDYLDL